MTKETLLESQRKHKHDLMVFELDSFQHPFMPKSEVSAEIIKWYDNRMKGELDEFLQWLLKNGYCDTDVYAEPPTAIDQYLAQKK